MEQRRRTNTTCSLVQIIIRLFLMFWDNSLALLTSQKHKTNNTFYNWIQFSGPPQPKPRWLNDFPKFVRSTQQEEQTHKYPCLVTGEDGNKQTFVWGTAFLCRGELI